MMPYPIVCVKRGYIRIGPVIFLCQRWRHYTICDTWTNRYWVRITLGDS